MRCFQQQLVKAKRTALPIGRQSSFKRLAGKKRRADPFKPSHDESIPATFTMIHETKFDRLHSIASLPQVIKANGLPSSYAHSLAARIHTIAPIPSFLDRNKPICFFFCDVVSSRGTVRSAQTTQSAPPCLKFGPPRYALSQRLHDLHAATAAPNSSRQD